MSRFRPWETADTIINWIVLPLAAISAVGNFVAGEVLHGIFAMIWGGLIYASQREYRGWRNRTNAWAGVEKRDRAKFAIDVLIMKSHVAASYARRHEELLDDPETRASVCALFRDVANTWIPDDAPDEMHALKAGALKTAESGDPSSHLRIVH